LDLNDLVKKFDLDIRGVLHVGAHLGEEAALYDSLGIKKVIWIDGNPDVMDKLHAVVDPYEHLVLQALISDQEGVVVPFNITNYDGMSSSIYEFGTHPNFSPDTVVESTYNLPTKTLDSLAEVYNFNDCNMANIDIEGAGLLALKGATGLMDQFDYLYLEVQTENVYDGAPLLGEIDTYLHDFNRVETGMVDGQGWGDALYLRQ
jgi:FkbM family methyltransferase